MHPTGSLLHITLLIGMAVASNAADSVFSGPQPNEPVTSFQVSQISGGSPGKVHDPVATSSGRALGLVFLHGIERSLVPLLRVIDEYGALQQEKLHTEVVFLSADRLAGEQRIKAASGSLKLLSHVSLSLDGLEGPGNYGLNKECLMTILAAKDGKVTANFALVQPGIADAPKILAALAKVCGDTNPPSAMELTERHRARSGTGGGAARADRMKNGAPGSNEKPKEPFPGAVPTDEKLQGLLRRFIRKTNDTATVDQILSEVRSHIEKDEQLKKQAMDGWVRILHFGDHYGTDYSRRVGKEFLQGLQREAKP